MADQPNKMRTSLRFVDFVTADFTAGTLALTQYLANGIYEPRVAGGSSHHPYGFHEAMLRYEKSTVYYSTIKAEFMSCTININAVWQLHLYKTLGAPQTAFTAGGGEYVSEIPHTSTSILHAANNMNTLSRSTNTLHYNACAFEGISPLALGSGVEHTGGAAADPTSPTYYGLSGYNPTGAASADHMQIKVTITYYVEFTQPVYIIP